MKRLKAIIQFSKKHWVAGQAMILAFLSMQVAFGQQKQVSHTNQQWLQYYTQTKLPGQWNLAADAGFRWKDFLRKKAQFILRAGIGRDLNSHLNVGLGYARSGFYRADTLYRLEHRPYQEVSLKSHYGSLEIAQRFRTEERIFKNLTDGTENFNLRFRYSWMCSIPLVKISNTQTGGRLLLNLGDEIFINAGKEIVYNVFDQNRFIIGLGWQINQHLTLNTNFNHQFAALSSPGSYRQDYVFWINGRQLFDLRPKS